MKTFLNENQIKVLYRLEQTLRENDIPFIVIGGLASIAWGVNRPLVDIDIQVSSSDLVRVNELLGEYVSTDMRHYVTASWDINQMILTMDKVGIDVCGAEDFYVVKDAERHLIKNCLDIAVVKDVAGISIPVLPKEVLIEYKKLIARPVDLQDIAQLES